MLPSSAPRRAVHHGHEVGARDRLAAVGHAGQGRGRVVAGEAGLLGVEVHQHVQVTVAVRILGVVVDVPDRGAGRPEGKRGLVHIERVEVEGIAVRNRRGQDRHRDGAERIGVDRTTARYHNLTIYRGNPPEDAATKP